jgi:hypothetical protein
MQLYNRATTMPGQSANHLFFILTIFVATVVAGQVTPTDN